VKHKILMLALSIAIIVGLVGIGCAPEAAEINVTMHTAAVGSAGYATATGLEALSIEKGGNIKISALESAGGGSTVAMILTKPEWKNDVIQMAPFWDKYAEGNIPGYEPEQKFSDVRGKIMDLVCFANANTYFVTLDSDIKTMKDLAGKRVAVGRIGQGTWGAIPTVFFKEVFPQLYPGLPEVEIEYCGGTNGATAALLDGKVDATIMGLGHNSDYSVTAEFDFMINLNASGRDSYNIEFTEEEVSAFLENSPSLSRTEMPANSTVNQPEPILCVYEPAVWGVLPDFPEETAYQFVKFYIENVGELANYTALAKITGTPEGLVGPIKREFMHPGAVRALEEAGVTVD